MAKYSARRAFFWQLIAKNRKRRLALHTVLSTGYQRRQLLVQVACLTVLLLANNNGAAVLSRSCHRLQRNANLWTGPLTARNGLKSSGYLDLHLSFYRIAFVTPLKKTPLLKSLVSTCSQFPEAKLSLYSACSSGGK